MNALIDFIVSLLIGVLTGLGVGSGGLFLVYMTLVRHAEQITAQGLNLAFLFMQRWRRLRSIFLKRE